MVKEFCSDLAYCDSFIFYKSSIKSGRERPLLLFVITPEVIDPVGLIERIMCKRDQYFKKYAQRPGAKEDSMANHWTVTYASPSIGPRIRARRARALATGGTTSSGRTSASISRVKERSSKVVLVPGLRS